MLKLLHASLYALWKNRIFWLELIAAAVFSVWIVFANYSPEVQASSDKIYLDDVFFTMYQLIILFVSAALSLIIGTEYSDGVIRNKLIVGHKRSHIYLSVLITALLSSLLTLLVHGAFTGALGYFLFGGFQMDTAKFASVLLCSVLAVMVITALFSAVSLNCSNKAATSVLSILLAIALMLMASRICSSLLEPETTYSYMSISMDGVEFGDLIDNPTYVDGTLRTVLEFIYDLLPVGQLLQINSMELEHMTRWLWMSPAFFAVITAFGLYGFKKRDIK